MAALSLTLITRDAPDLPLLSAASPAPVPAFAAAGELWFLVRLRGSRVPRMARLRLEAAGGGSSSPDISALMGDKGEWLVGQDPGLSSPYLSWRRAQAACSFGKILPLRQFG